MDRKDNLYCKNLHELDLDELAEFCGNVAINHSANQTQAETAHSLRMESIRLSLNHSPRDDEKEAKRESLKKRMVEFLSDLPSWMMSGV